MKHGAWDEDDEEDKDGVDVFRGCLFAIALSLVFFAVLGLVFWYLMR